MEQMDTETIDKLFLELSQFTSATTAKEMGLRKMLQIAEDKCAKLQGLAHDAIQAMGPVPENDSARMKVREIVLQIYRGG